MRGLLTVAQMLVRITGVLLLILGLLLWVEGMRNLVSIHTILGLVLVLSLWVLAGVAARLGAPLGLSVGVALMGLITLALGMSQGSLMPGASHWIIQGLHLLVGLAAVGLAEALGGRLRRVRLAGA